MKFEIKKTKGKNDNISKTLYLDKLLSDKIKKIAKENESSWSNVVISVIEACLNDENDTNLE